MKVLTIGQLALLVFTPLLLLPIIIVILKIFQVIVGRFVGISEEQQAGLEQQRNTRGVLAGRILKTRPSAIVRFCIEINVGLILLATFGRVFSLPLYLYVEAKLSLPFIVKFLVEIILFVAPLVFAVLITIELMRILHKHLFT